MKIPGMIPTLVGTAQCDRFPILNLIDYQPNRPTYLKPCGQEDLGAADALVVGMYYAD